MGKLTGAWAGGLTAGLFCLALGKALAAPLEVIATTPDLRSVVQAIGGERLQAASLIADGGNAETYQPRPQDIQKLRAAAMVVRIGLDFDLWLDPLLAKAGRDDLRRGGRGHIDVSNGIALLEVRSAVLDAGSGHGHGGGNPHYWLDPANMEIISTNIVNGLLQVDAGYADYYRRNYQRFVDVLRQNAELWQQRMAEFAGRPLLVYHDSWAYFARRYRLHVVAIVEPKPGIAPSPSRLASLIGDIRRQQINTLVRQVVDPQDSTDLLRDRTGIGVATLAASVGELAPATDYVALMQYNIDTLARALRVTAR